ncbi:MAG: PEP-CTERM sorting domain-containing protein [Microcystis aeruginosa BS13-02]|jgi:hypothetical protein|nr:PEP-CTERM sorting domain-containing protein [Microcystis aeruginosa BS13-02]
MKLCKKISNVLGLISGVTPLVTLATLGISGKAQAFQLIPPGLNPGDKYRLVFVTDGTRNATSMNIADYNTFVNDEAHNSTTLNTAFTSAGINPTSIIWKVIGSTSPGTSFDAISNTHTDISDVSVPFYTLDGRLVATGNHDLWDGSISHSINVSPTGSQINSWVWTGTFYGGNVYKDPAYRPPYRVQLWPYTLGNSVSNTGAPPSMYVAYGNTLGVGLEWICCTIHDPRDKVIANNIQQNTATLPLYGMSGILTVPGSSTPTQTPEPDSLIGHITLGGIILGSMLRKAQKSG